MRRRCRAGIDYGKFGPMYLGAFAAQGRVQYVRSHGWLRRRRLRRHLPVNCHRVLATLLLTAALTACKIVPGPSEPVQPLGLTRDANGDPQVLYLLCPGEKVTSIEIIESSDASEQEQVLWSIDSTDGVETEAVRVGEVPPGFNETVPLKVPLERFEELIVVLNSRSEGRYSSVAAADFVPSALKAGRIMNRLTGSMSPDEFERLRRCRDE